MFENVGFGEVNTIQAAATELIAKQIPGYDSAVTDILNEYGEEFSDYEGSMYAINQERAALVDNEISNLNDEIEEAVLAVLVELQDEKKYTKELAYAEVFGVYPRSPAGQLFSPDTSASIYIPTVEELKAKYQISYAFEFVDENGKWQKIDHHPILDWPDDKFWAALKGKLYLIWKKDNPQWQIKMNDLIAERDKLKRLAIVGAQSLSSNYTYANSQARYNFFDKLKATKSNSLNDADGVFIMNYFTFGSDRATFSDVKKVIKILKPILSISEKQELANILMTDMATINGVGTQEFFFEDIKRLGEFLNPKISALAKDRFEKINFADARLPGYEASYSPEQLQTSLWLAGSEGQKQNEEIMRLIKDSIKLTHLYITTQLAPEINSQIQTALPVVTMTLEEKEIVTLAKMAETKPEEFEQLDLSDEKIEKIAAYQDSQIENNLDKSTTKMPLILLALAGAYLISRRK